jgi:ubiquinol oxidase
MAGRAQSSSSSCLNTLPGRPIRPGSGWVYLALAKHRRRSALARRVFDRIVQTRAEQDNEQWHLLILQDLARRRGLRQSFVKHRLAPWLIAFFYYHVSWLLFLVRPEWSYRLNADFEDHAEHEYMRYVAAHPELETQPDPGGYAAEYGPVRLHRRPAAADRP